jgi:cytochrome c-type biogenesis protein CcmH
MNLWFVFALMTVAAVFAVLWPLGRRYQPQAGGSEESVYRDQLAEIDRDLAGGLIAAAEADSARIEISRRLLAATDSRPPALPSGSLRRAVAIVALIGLPLTAAALYLPLGSPQLGDFPLASRAQAPDAKQPLVNLVAQVEAHLEKNPTDGRGWTVLAPVLGRLGRYDDAVRAWRNAITYGGDSAERRADLGETMMAAAGGVVTGEAKAEFERAVAMNADEVKARYFLGLAAEQDGRTGDAQAIWKTMLAKAPSDAPWIPLVQAAIARSGGAVAPPLSDDTMAAAKEMPDADRNAMVRGMVERLAARLKQNGDDVEGWVRLVRSWMVMGERDRAMSAQADARKAVGGDAERLRQLNEGLKDLGLDVAPILAPKLPPLATLPPSAPSAPPLSDDTMAAAKQMTEGDRNAMIRGMVDRLATRLKQNGDDVEGWLRLVRAYIVMGDRDKAISARTDAREAVGGDAQRLRQLNEGLKTLGLDG